MLYIYFSTHQVIHWSRHVVIMVARKRSIPLIINASSQDTGDRSKALYWCTLTMPPTPIIHLSDISDVNEMMVVYLVITGTAIMKQVWHFLCALWWFIDKGGRSSRVDVVALLVGLIAGGVAIVIFGIVVWLLCQRRWKGNLSHERWVRRICDTVPVCLFHLFMSIILPIIFFFSHCF